MNSQQSKLMGHKEGHPDREVHRYTGLPKKNRNISNKQPYKNLRNNNKENPEQVHGRE